MSPRAKQQQDRLQKLEVSIPSLGRALRRELSQESTNPLKTLTTTRSAVHVRKQILWKVNSQR